MKLTDAISLMKGRFGNRTDPEFEAQLRLEMQLAQDNLEGLSFLPHFLVNEELSCLTLVEDERVPLPKDFIKEYDAEASGLFIVLEGVRKRLEKLPPVELLTKYPEENTFGTPAAYTLTGNYLRVRPVPDQRYQLLMICYQKDSPVESVVENDWLKYEPELLLSYTGESLATFLQDEKRATMFGERAKAALERMRVAIVERGEAGKVNTMGEGN
jgi:hypothetical protein